MTVQAAEPRSLLRRFYDWCLEAAHKPHAIWSMSAVAFAESSFFPVPPDIMLIPMSLARPERAYLLAAWCTVASVLGGLVGYAIGALLYNSVGAWLIGLYGYGDKVEAFRAAYAQWGAWIILLKGLTPIPFKVVTITSGFAGYSLGLFLVVLADHARRPVFHPGVPAAPLRRAGPLRDRTPARLVDPGLCRLSGWRHGRGAVLDLSESALLSPKRHSSFSPPGGLRGMRRRKCR